MMTDEAREMRRAYKRKWQREHPDKVREYQERHWEKVAAQAEEAAKEKAIADSQGGDSDTEV